MDPPSIPNIKRLPIPHDFPSLTTTTFPPPPNSPYLSSLLILLHGLGDTADPYISLGRQLNLPETTILVVRAPNPLPFDLGGFHWCDDVVFDDAGGGGLDPDAGFNRAGDTMSEILRGLRKAGWRERELLFWGVGQGGMVALRAGCASLWESYGEMNVEGQIKISQVEEHAKRTVPEFGGIISLGGALPSGTSLPCGAEKSRTPVLVGGGSSETQVPDGKVEGVKRCYAFVETARWRRKGDGMPRDRDEMMPIMRFLANRARSRAGVPKGSVEIGADRKPMEILEDGKRVPVAPGAEEPPPENMRSRMRQYPEL